MDKRIYGTGSPWEDQIGYGRAVKVGEIMEVSGTVARLGEEIIGVGDAYAQTKFIIEKIESVTKQADMNLNHVVRTRIYVTNMSDWEAVGKAHGEAFSKIKPATSMIEVNKLIEDEYLVEI